VKKNVIGVCLEQIEVILYYYVTSVSQELLGMKILLKNRFTSSMRMWIIYSMEMNYDDLMKIGVRYKNRAIISYEIIYIA